ncbi:MAG: class I SAM-dependent methyltransferase [Clostridiales bacterium]|jgi:tRNA (adenine22-N1)-methyltransferase|nr:class I SAM-dependent methyltransferase [Clostridiales bacterium]
MALSKRLECILQEISCVTLADIGSDHGLIPVSALEEGRCQKAIATDISASSEKNVLQLAGARGVLDRIEFRRGDGLAPLSLGEAQVIVITGMGGLLIESIVKNHLDLALKSRLVLSPQRDQPILRKSLGEMGFAIKKERLVFEGEKPYNIFVCEADKEKEYTELELLFGRRLLEEKNPELLRLLETKLNKDKLLLQRLKASGKDDRSRNRIGEVESSIAQEEGAIRWLSKPNG